MYQQRMFALHIVHIAFVIPGFIVWYSFWTHKMSHAMNTRTLYPNYQGKKAKKILLMRFIILSILFLQFTNSSYCLPLSHLAVQIELCPILWSFGRYKTTKRTVFADKCKWWAFIFNNWVKDPWCGADELCHGWFQAQMFGKLILHVKKYFFFDLYNFS